MSNSYKQIDVKIRQYLTAAALVITSGSMMFTSCEDPNSPGLEYMPDMYRSPSLEAYAENDFWADSMATRKPVENTIPRAQSPFSGNDAPHAAYAPFDYENTTEDYQRAGEELKNPVPYSEEVVKQGEAVYEKFCVQCHGEKGKGDGPVAQNPRWPGPPPAYDGRIKDLPEGKIFFSIHYGKNLMGSHAAQISREDRWKLVYYVQKLQGHDLDKMYGKNNTSGGEDSEEVSEAEEMSNDEATASL